MKKKEFITKEKYVDVSDADIVRDFMENEFYVGDWDCGSYIYYDPFWKDYELTDEDKKRISELIKVEIKKEIENYREQEKQLLKDRKSILYFLSSHIESYDIDPGKVGYMLSDEEILDLILENGRK